MSDEPGTIRPTLIDLNTEQFEFEYYPFMIKQIPFQSMIKHI